MFGEHAYSCLAETLPALPCVVIISHSLNAAELSSVRVYAKKLYRCRRPTVQTQDENDAMILSARLSRCRHFVRQVCSECNIV